MSHHRREDREHFIDEIRQKQQNIVFPDTVKNAASVDEFLWKGSSKPSLVQSIGAWLLGLPLVGIGILMLIFAKQREEWLAGLLSLGAILLGVKICSAAYPMRKQVSQAIDEAAEQPRNVVTIDAGRGEDILFWRVIRGAGYCVIGLAIVGFGVFVFFQLSDSFLGRMFSISLVLVGARYVVVDFRKRWR